MKRIFAIILSIVLLLSLCACGNNKKAEKYCSSCGEGISKDVSFCEHCGAAVNNEKTESEDVLSNSASSTESQNGDTSKQTETSKPITSSNPTSNTNTPSTSKPSTPAHTHSYSKKVTAATCTKKGYTTHTCSCGDSYKDNYTNPSHTYSNYKCTKCEQMDKDNFYTFLKDWVLKYGKTNGEFISYKIPYSQSEYFTTSISYSASEDSVFLNCFFMDQEQDVSNTTLMEIPKTPTNKYIYSCGLYRASDSTQLIYCQGNILSNTYTKNSPLACNNFVGDKNFKQDIINIANTEVSIMLQDFDTFLKEYQLGYTLKDLGFTSFK